MHATDYATGKKSETIIFLKSNVYYFYSFISQLLMVLLMLLLITAVQYTYAQQQCGNFQYLNTTTNECININTSKTTIYMQLAIGRPIIIIILDMH